MLAVVTELESSKGSDSCNTRVINAYSQVVERNGNTVARKALEDVFESCDQVWRGMGTLPQSGLKLRSKYQAFDATERFVSDAGSIDYPALATIHNPCRAAEVLKGKIRPTQCEALGNIALLHILWVLLWCLTKVHVPPIIIIKPDMIPMS